MSSDGVCVAITHAGARCASPAADAAGHCAHHARMARVMALAPKAAPSVASSTASSSSSSSSSVASSSAYDMSALRSTVASNGYAPSAAAPSPASYSAAPSPPSSGYSILQSPLIAAAVNSAISSSSSSSSSPSPAAISQASYSAAPSPPSGSYSILQSPLIAAAVNSAISSSSSSSSPSPAAISQATASRGSSKHAWMLAGESLLSSVNVTFMFPTPLGLPSLPGSLFVTSYRLRFEPSNSALRSPGHFHRLLDDAIEGIPRACVAKLSYPQMAPSSRSRYDTPSQLVIKFKDIRSWTLGGDITTLMTTLNRHVFVDSPVNLFAFAPRTRTRQEEEQALCGHRIFDLQRDFQRMGVDLRHSAYRVTDVNRNYTMCATYPQQLVVPSSVSDSEILSVAEFRSKGRLPICCFVHSRNTASIWRCAQPKRGIFNAQNVADERYLARLAGSNHTQQKLWIADCRPELNARVNKLTGGGTESSSLHHARISFLNIANIHAMRESIETIRSLAGSPNSDMDFSWLVRVEETKWLQHVRLVLSAALRVADAVENRQTTVLVHCSDGWDRTGQLCALSQMLLDKHYRTIVGFMQVVEKEWILAGHKFHDRVGPGKTEDEEQSPVFLQFLDCVWQLWRQYPTYFEFNPKFLEEIADALFSGRFGTFLGNCDRERTTWGSYTRTPSLWAHILAHLDRYTNPFYREQSEKTLIPPSSTLLRNVTLWTDYYFRGATFDTNPAGNNTPPTWGSVQSTPRSTHQDLADAMAAATLKIHVLEQELSLLRGDTCVSLTPASATAYGAVPATLSSLPPPPSVSTPFVPTLFEAQPPAPAAVSPPQSSTAPVLPPGSWACAICSKVNLVSSSKCGVCGRPPPPAAVTTQL